MDIMSDDLKSAKSALAKLHQDMDAINRLAKPSYLSVVEQMERTLEPIRRQHLEISRALEMSGAMARIQEILTMSPYSLHRCIFNMWFFEESFDAIGPLLRTS